MSDVVLYSPDLATLQADAQSLGFYVPGVGFITQGPVPGDPDPLASFFLNIVGVVQQPTGQTTTDGMGNTVPVMAPIPGYWARLRVNGTSPFRPGGMTIPPSLTVYSLVTPANGSAPFWTADGTTPAPAYVAAIGTIA